MLNAGGSYAVYASWFQKQLGSYPKKLHSLGNNNAAFNAIESPNLCKCNFEITSNRIAPENFKIFTVKKEASLSLRALGALEKALKISSFSSKLEEELKLLLFGKQNEISQSMLLDTLHSVAVSQAKND
jgi:hypothetical protein